MIIVKDQRIRLALDSSQWFQQATDVITSAAPQIANGADLQFELAFSYGAYTSDAQVVDLSHWSSVQVSLKSSTMKTSLALWSATTSSLNNGLTFANWTAGTDQAVVISLTNLVNNIFMPNDTGTYWLVVEALTTDSPAKIVPVACFAVTVVENGLGTQAPSSVTTAQYYTQQQSDARYLATADLSAKANLSGATFTGAVVLASGQMSGATGLYAATKAYVDSGDAATAAASVPNTGTSTIAGLKTFSALVAMGAGLTISAGTLTVTALGASNSGNGGILLCNGSGVIASNATTNNLPEFSTNLYFTTARVLATVLTGYAAATGTIAATDTVLSAMNKIGYALAHLPGTATVWPVSSQAAMLALSSAAKGDIAVRSDNNTNYVLGSGSYTILGSWTPLLVPVTSVLGLTGDVTFTSDLVTEGSTNLYFTNSRADARVTAQRNVANGVCPLDVNTLVPWANIPPLTGFTAGAGTVLATDTILQAIQKMVGNEASFVSASGFTATGAIRFSGSTNPGLVVNQLQTSQINALSSGGTNYGAIVYDTNTNQLKSLVNGTWIVLGSATPYLPLAAGSGNQLTGVLQWNDGLSLNMQLGNAWKIRTSASNNNFDVLNNSNNVVLTCLANANVMAPNGWFDTNTGNGYRVNGANALYYQSSVTTLDFGGGYKVNCDGSYAALHFSYGNNDAFTITAALDVVLTHNLKVNSGTLVIDSGNKYYDSSGNQLLNGRQSSVADSTAVTGTATADAGNVCYGFASASEFNAFVSGVNAIITNLNSLLAKMRPAGHGLISN